MSGGYFPDGGLFGFAAVGAVGAAGVEGTALGGIYRRGHFAFQYTGGIQAVPDCRAGNRIEQERV